MTSRPPKIERVTTSGEGRKPGSTGIEFLDLYLAMLKHQRRPGHGRGLTPSLRSDPQPWEYCLKCLTRGHSQIGTDSYRPGNRNEPHGVKRHYAWAVPSERALETIAKHSPGGVVEIGAGGGYWAMLLQQRGVDVVAYDPVPPPGESNWHAGKAWTAVLAGDHTAVAHHPNRTLLLCWPSYSEPWPADALELYAGDTVIYIGEGSGGCTADDRFHVLLGHEPYCWHHDDDYKELPCPEDCPAKLRALFEEIDDVAIPQWSGIHDRLTVYRRVDA